MLRPAMPYLAAVFGVAVATLVRYLLDPVLARQVPFITFFAAVAFAAWYGGLRPALLAILVSWLAAECFFIDPRGVFALGTWDIGKVAGTLAFLSVTLIIATFSEGMFRARERLAREHGLLNVTLSSIGDAVISTDRIGRTVFMNPVAESLTGWTLEKARGTQLLDIFHIVNEETRERVEDPCAKVLRTGRVVGLANHTVLISKDGTERPIDDSAAPIHNDEGDILGVVLVFHDVTEKRVSERALAQSERQLSDFFENSAVGLHWVDKDGIIIRTNQAELDLLGYERDEYIGHSIAEFYVDKSVIEDIMNRLAAGETIESYEAQLKCSDGAIKDVIITSNVLWEEEQFVHTRCFTRDISERKRAEEQLAFLAKASNNIAALVDRESALRQAANIVVPFFADWCVVHTVRNGSIHHQACAHPDPEKEHILCDMLERYPLKWTSPIISVETLRTGKSQLVERMTDKLFDLVSVNEEHRTMLKELEPRSIISVPLTIREDTFGVINFVVSNPGRCYTPKDLPFAEDLATRIATAIDNAYLFSSVKEADRQKDEFLAMLAHELRNPLAAIGYAASIARMSNGESTAEMFAMIDRQVNNLARLIDDLLDVARLSRDRIQLKKEAVDASTIITRAVAALRSNFDKKKHDLVLDVSPQRMPLFVDSTRAEQVIANLLANAAKYTPEGGRVTLRAYPEGGEVVIKVTDTGVGLHSEMVPRVFDLFTQVDRSLDRSEGGLGIGLTLVRKLTEMHGGSVAASSPGLGQGSEFTVRLPLSDSTAPQQPPTSTPDTLPRLRILVVNDNQDTAKSAALLLKTAQQEVQVAHDGIAAVESARAFRPDVVLLDIGLPGMNGYDVARKLRQEGFTNQTLIAISGYGQAEDQRRSREAGFDHHLVKPVEPEALFTLLHGVTAATPSRDESDSPMETA